ncbi:hypothetical protein QAD02_015287 [Eretmocerus hayati]|uniref:Uncharacterized protein n=1 Tax=Eretmocerus hayati TaxID=131215 RepID=A0ACC2PCK9_9HYME|nr:hypothetical protein QAD02_015287 [Eretmocerus hayati]
MPRRLLNALRPLSGPREFARVAGYWILATILLIFCLHPARFAARYDFIAAQDIPLELEHAHSPLTNACSAIITGNSQLAYPEDPPTEEAASLARRLSIIPGGQWTPSHCRPVFSVALVLPYRDRESQLSAFTNYIHPFLQAQNLDYQVFVVEQSPGKRFNRAKLFNIGFVEASRAANFHCFIFQDVDLVPQNLDNIYACTRLPRHMSSSVNTLRYNLPYTGLFGGAIAITKKQFERVNGFSNVYFGWGGEDDDFYTRLQNRGLPVVRFDPDVAQYYMLPHKKEVPSSERLANLELAAERVDTDGLSDLEYRVLNHQLRPLYSWILAEV